MITRPIKTAALIAMLAMPIAAADDQTANDDKAWAGKTTYTNAAGGQLEVVRGKKVDDEGNVHYGRAWRATDKDGDVRGKGVTTAHDNADGTKAANKRSVRYREDGTTVKRRGQARDDGEGNKKARRGKNVYDEDGNLVRARRDKARNNADGSKTRVKKRKRINDDGSVDGQYRRMDKDTNGNRRVRRARGHKSGN